jgi:hypothetical protein
MGKVEVEVKEEVEERETNEDVFENLLLIF